MTKVRCVDSSCKYISEDDWVCTKSNICISWSDVATVHQGRQHFHRCKDYEESDMFKNVKEYMATL